MTSGYEALAKRIRPLARFHSIRSLISGGAGVLRYIRVRDPIRQSLVSNLEPLSREVGDELVYLCSTHLFVRNRGCGEITFRDVVTEIPHEYLHMVTAFELVLCPSGEAYRAERELALTRHECFALVKLYAKA